MYGQSFKCLYFHIFGFKFLSIFSLIVTGNVKEKLESCKKLKGNIESIRIEASHAFQLCKQPNKDKSMLSASLKRHSRRFENKVLSGLLESWFIRL